MANNNDYVMSRFLFAILEQKCLKDIDWNKVARNPILAQSITNGHAARMRFSRFKSSVLGLEPQRRRVSKKKKDEPVKKPKKEEEEKASGSGIGNIKLEAKTEAAPSATIKSEQITMAPVPSQPLQPPAPMGIPDLVKTESGNAAGHSEARFARQPSVMCIASPNIKKETLPQNTAGPVPAPAGPTTTPVSISEPSQTMVTTTDNQVTAAPTFSASPTPLLDNTNYRPMPLRLPTPCSDADGMPAFLRNTPPPSAVGDLFHSQRSYPHSHPYPQHQHQSQHHHVMVGAGSPPLSSPASSPYDLSQCMDFEPSSAPNHGSSVSPWQSQPAPFHAPYYDAGGNNGSQTYQNSHNTAAAPLFPVPVQMTGGYSGYSNNPHAGPFCGDHASLHQHHHQQLQQKRYHHALLSHPLVQHPGCSDEDAPGDPDPLSLPLPIFGDNNNNINNGSNSRSATLPPPGMDRDMGRIGQDLGHFKFHNPFQAHPEAQRQSQAQAPSQRHSESQARAQTPGHGHGHGHSQSQGQDQSEGQSQSLAGGACGREGAQGLWAITDGHPMQA
ncbi:hypothetical protein VTJ49DRAFT_7098 [Mycothermus thermophilus]|uniref:Myb-like DNA-binding domain-containing protein n=1 Tax=Humicola insolens TaxID=85995 RepID=A0ABR3VIW6_HUMIN